MTQVCSVKQARALSGRRLTGEDGYEFEYALALVQTSAALVYTINLCRQHGLDAVTDSNIHFKLLARTLARDGISLENRLVLRDGY
jgi:hypothetical protein